MKGLNNKYDVTKSDGSPVDPMAQYFVLRLDTDRHARDAARAYADSVQEDNPILAHDIRMWLRGIEIVNLP